MEADLAKTKAKNRRSYGQIFLDALKSLGATEDQFVSKAEMKAELGWDDQRYASTRLELIRTNQIVARVRGPGGTLGFPKNKDIVKLSVFVSYSHTDKVFLELLTKHLALLRRLNLISTWVDLEIKGGDHWDKEISKKMANADIFLLLVSPDFINSDYCYEIELDAALERDAKKEARVIPIIVRNCLWKQSKIAHLQALMPEGKAISAWSDKDDAMTDIAKSVFDIATEMKRGR